MSEEGGLKATDEIIADKAQAKAVTPKADPELDCVICLTLVLNATQSSCCGSTFCRTCIHVWLDSNDTCPTCRSNIKEAKDIHPDCRTDRKSSQQSRPCKYNEEHGCDFTGNRKEVEDHEPRCPEIPAHVHRAKVTALEKEKRELDAKISRLEIEKAHDKREVSQLKQQRDEAQRGLESMKQLLGRGLKNWMTEKEFEKFLKDGRFAVGTVTSTGG